MLRCPNAIGRTHMRQYTLLKIVILSLTAWSAWYYAVWIGAQLKDKVIVAVTDFWPGFLITIAMCFIPLWDTNSGARFTRAFGASYSGGICSVSCFKTLVGGGLFMVGLIWGIAIATVRFIMPLPNAPHASTTLPGWLMLVHIVLLVVATLQVLEYTMLPTDPGYTVAAVAKRHVPDCTR